MPRIDTVLAGQVVRTCSEAERDGLF